MADVQSIITMIKEVGSFGVIVWLLIVEIPQYRAAIQRNTEALERLTNLLLQKEGKHEPLPH